MSAQHFHPRYTGMNPVKRLSHCYCHTLTQGRIGSEACKRGIIERLLLALIPHFDIVKTIEGPNHTKQTVLYLRRYYIFRSKWFGMNFGDIYLHHIVRSDDDPDPHDHPWGFVGLILKTGYTDESYRWIPPRVAGMVKYTEFVEKGDRVEVQYRLEKVGQDEPGRREGPFLEEVKPFTIIRRKAEHIHRVITKGEPAWTLIFTTAYGRDWNFITEKGPVFWRKYLGIPDDTDYGE